jgi:hypothetical protein
MREAQKVERFRLPFSSSFPVLFLAPSYASAYRRLCVRSPRCRWNPQVSRVPLPDGGVIAIGEACTTSWEDVTPPSSLLQTHPPIPSGSPLLQPQLRLRSLCSLPPDPCGHRDLPGVISANLSSDAWSHAAAVPRSAHAYSFLRVIGLAPTGVWVGFPLQPANTTFHGASFEAADISLCSGLLRVYSPPRSSLPLRLTAQGSRGFYIQAHRPLLPPHAPDMLAARYGQLTASGLSPDRIRSLVGCSPCLRFAGHLAVATAKLGAEWIATPFS